MATILASTLRDAALRRADLKSSAQTTAFITESEALDMVNAAASELHDLLVTTYSDYFQKSSDLSFAAGVEYASLPSDFYKALGAWWLDGGLRRRIDQFMLDELSDHTDALGLSTADNGFARYRIAGGRMYLSPAPNAAMTIQLWYVPQLAKMTATDDLNASGFENGAIVNGWEEYIVIDAAIQMREKAEMSTAGLWARKNALAARIRAAAQIRDAGKPQRVRDVYMSRAIRRSRMRW